METVFKILQLAATDKNIDYAILLDVCIAFLYLFNIVLGAIIGTKTDKFDFKKFMFGVVKALIVMVIIVGVCFALNIFVLTINEIEGLSISSSIITVIELLGVLVSVAADLSAEVLEKIKSFRELKYTSYDDNVPIVNNQDLIEPTDLRG